jgi:hypothetical protein
VVALQNEEDGGAEQAGGTEGGEEGLAVTPHTV